MRVSGRKQHGTDGRTESVRYGGRTYNIPVDKRGFVPKAELAKRFTGQSSSKVISDGSRNAKNSRPWQCCRPSDIVRWWRDPGSSDIKGIDDKGSVIPKTKDPVRKRVAVFGGTKDEQKRVRDYVMGSFTRDEIRRTTDKRLMVFHIKENGGSSYYDPKKDLIELERKEIRPDYVVHESVHRIKRFDMSGNRRYWTRSMIDRITSDKDIKKEEATTEAETVARMTPYRPSNPGYYRNIEDMDSDRRLFTGSSKKGGKGVVGKDAIEVIETKYPMSKISRVHIRLRK